MRVLAIHLRHKVTVEGPLVERCKVGTQEVGTVPGEAVVVQLQRRRKKGLVGDCEISKSGVGGGKKRKAAKQKVKQFIRREALY